MQSDDSEPGKSRGSRQRDRIEAAAKQLKHARTQADGWEATALRALEADCYQLLTGGFQRASELLESTRQAPLADGEGDEA
jgi:hypothetical protein